VTSLGTEPGAANGSEATRPRSGIRRTWLVAVILVVLVIFGVGLWLGRVRGDQTSAVAVSQPGGIASPVASSGVPVQPIDDLGQLPPGKVDHLEVTYFHRTQRCSGCIEAERLTRKTLDTYFAERLKSGEMSLVVADVEKPLNAALVQKYDAWGSSLYLGVVKEGVEYTWMARDIWFSVNDEAQFMASLRDTIDSILAAN
jgi:hypothetical protein